MKPASFEYFGPTTVDEAVALLGQYNSEGDAKILAGGQSLVPLMNFRLAKPKYLIDINGIASLNYIKDEGDWIAFGATTRERQVEHSALVAETCPLLAEATKWIGHTTIRSRGTIGGCLAHNDPTAEYPLAASVLGAEVVVQGPNGKRQIPVEEFFVTFLTTSLESTEILTEVRFPKMPKTMGWSFQEFARRHGDFAVVGAAATLTMDSGKVKEAHLALAGCGATAFRATDAEAILNGQQLTDALIDQAAEKAAGMADPESDVHASAEYRTHLAKVLSRKAIKEAQTRAK